MMGLCLCMAPFVQERHIKKVTIAKSCALLHTVRAHVLFTRTNQTKQGFVWLQLHSLRTQGAMENSTELPSLATQPQLLYSASNTTKSQTIRWLSTSGSPR